MSASREYRGRRAAIVENDEVRVTVLEEGGHIAEILDKRSSIRRDADAVPELLDRM